MNHTKIFIVACIFSSYILGAQKPIIAICDKSSLLAFISSIINSKTPGKIETRHIPCFKYMIYSSPNNFNRPLFSYGQKFQYRPLTRSIATETNSSIFEQENNKKTILLSIFQRNNASNLFGLTPDEVSLHIAHIGIIDPKEELKVANIIHCTRPGIIESIPGKGCTARYHDERIETEQSKK